MHLSESIEKDALIVSLKDTGDEAKEMERKMNALRLVVEEKKKGTGWWRVFLCDAYFVEPRFLIIL